MADADPQRFRQRLIAAGARIPEETIDVVVSLAGPLMDAQDRLATLDLGDVEPFSPSRRLPDDAG